MLYSNTKHIKKNSDIRCKSTYCIATDNVLSEFIIGIKKINKV